MSGPAQLVAARRNMMRIEAGNKNQSSASPFKLRHAPALVRHASGSAAAYVAPATYSHIHSLASKLQPCIIFIDEVDSLLGKRGSGQEHEAMLQVRGCGWVALPEI